MQSLWQPDLIQADTYPEPLPASGIHVEIWTHFLVVPPESQAYNNESVTAQQQHLGGGRY